MKRNLLVLGFVVALALNAGAQTYIDFSGMPFASVPTPMANHPAAVSNLFWDNFLYVTPGMWHGAGPGFWVDPTTQHNTVLFIGGPWQSVAQGSIVMRVQQPPNVSTFQPVSITLSSGWIPNGVVVTAYANSRLVGTLTWNLTTTPAIHQFPATWTNITQLVFTADPSVANAVHPQPGSMVIYNFLLIER